MVTTRKSIFSVIIQDILNSSDMYLSYIKVLISYHDFSKHLKTENRSLSDKQY